MAEMIWAIVCIVLTVVCLGISAVQFKERGFLFHNAYIWASKQERDRMDKKPYYRQSAVAFALCGAIFLVMAME